MEQDAVEKAADIAGMFTPENIMGYWEKILPSLLNIAAGLAILLVGMWVAKRVGKFVGKQAAKVPNIDTTLGNFLGSLAKYAITAFVVIAAITKMGMETTSLVAMLGAATLAIGLALQGTLGNIAAGVMLMLFRPYKIGDYVDVAGQEGVVDQVSIFTTELATIDNIKVIIANGEAWGSTIKNFTSMGLRRVDVTYGIDYGDDIDKAIAIMKKVSAAHPNVLSQPDGPWAKVVGLGDSSVDIQNRVWCKADDYWDVMFDLNKSIKEAFDKGGITIPYPHIVHVDGGS